MKRSLFRMISWTTVILVVHIPAVAVRGDFDQFDPTFFGKDDPRTKELQKQMGSDVRKQLLDAADRETREFRAVHDRKAWEAYRNLRIDRLRRSLGDFPDPPKSLNVRLSRTIDGEGYRLENTLIETRPGWWQTANVYRPLRTTGKVPAILIVPAHHTAKTHGELQDMGMTWARSGTIVMVVDPVGYGERREHGFHSEKDFAKSFRVSRQDYYFRFNSNLQLSTIGDSLMGWIVWDLMRSVDYLGQLKEVDRDRMILMGSVAGGGDPAGVTAALDSRISCVVPFNFGGWQPELAGRNPTDGDFPWFGDGYWESTRGLRGGAAGGFAHFAIVGSIAPRKLIYAHEFAWDPKIDPAWPRLQKIYGFYDGAKNISFAHGAGTVRESGPGNTHCTHIGAVHRKMIYPALKTWFDMPIPEEYSNRRSSTELLCWTDELRKELRPKSLADMVRSRSEAEPRLTTIEDGRKYWADRLGNISARADANVMEGKVDDLGTASAARFALQTDPGITVPLILLTPKKSDRRPPIVVMVAQGGKSRLLRERSEAVQGLLAAGAAVCLVDVRGTGETRPGDSAERGSSRTSISQTNLIAGRSVLGMQLRDLRTVLQWLRGRADVDGRYVAVWGDSMSKPNATDVVVAVPHDAPQPSVAEPSGANLAFLAGLFEESVRCVYARGAIADSKALSSGPYLHIPHDAVVPGPRQVTAESFALLRQSRKLVMVENAVDAVNRVASTGSPADLKKTVAAILDHLGRP